MNSTLQTIAKLSGSFSFGAAISQICSSESCHELGQEAWNSVNLFTPSTARCFSLLGSSGVTKTVRLSPIWAKTESGHDVKIYPVAARMSPISSQFTFSNLRLALIRGALFAYFPVIESYFKQLGDEEQAAMDRGEEYGLDDVPEFDWEAAKERLPIAALNFAKEIVVGVVRVLLGWATSLLDDRLAWKLIKEQSSSLKAKRVLPFYLRPYRITKTVIRGSMIPTIAEFLVSSTIDTCKTVFYGEDLKPNDKFRLVLRRAFALSIRSLILLVSGAVGAGFIAAFRPGSLCTIFAVLTQFLVDSYICLPEITPLISRGEVSNRLRLLIAGSLGLLILSFWPWFRRPSNILSYEEVPALALQF